MRKESSERDTVKRKTEGKRAKGNRRVTCVIHQHELFVPCDLMSPDAATVSRLISALLGTVQNMKNIRDHRWKFGTHNDKLT